MTNWDAAQTELEQIAEDATDQMRKHGLNPEERSIRVENHELWITIWFPDQPDTKVLARNQEAMTILKEKITTSSSLPTTVNANYEADTGENFITAWWHSG